MKRLTCIAVFLCIAGALHAAEPSADDGAFDRLWSSVQRDPARVSEADVIRLLELGRKLGRPTAASLAAKAYLGHHFDPSARFLLLAAENAISAGDCRAAVSRYKAYLKAAEPGEPASNAAAALYRIQIDCLRDKDDAYESIGTHAPKSRQSINARKFEGWYLNEAAGRGDAVGAAKMLAIVLADKLPLEQERLHYWGYLDWLGRKVTDGADRHLAALPDLKKIVPLIRGDVVRTRRFAFYVANLEHKAARVGKAADAVEQEFRKVVAAAQSYFDTRPDADTLKDVTIAFLGGHQPAQRYNPGWWNGARTAWAVHGARKTAFFAAAFNKLKDAGRNAMLEWQHRDRVVAASILTPKDWAGLAAAHPKLFRESPVARQLRIFYQSKDPAAYRKYAAFASGMPTEDAAAINSLAAGNGLAQHADHLLTKETWHLGFTRVYYLLQERIRPAFAGYTRAEKDKLAKNQVDEAMLRFAAGKLARSPVVLFDTRAAADYVVRAWYYSGVHDNDKSQVAAHVQALAWVPYTETERRAVFSSTYDNFNRWAGKQRSALSHARSQLKSNQNRHASAVKALDKAKGKANKRHLDYLAGVVKKYADAVAAWTAKEKDMAATADLIAPLEAAFKAALAPPAGDLPKAPDPLSAQLRDAVVAHRAKDRDAFVKVARGLYARVRDYDVKRTPFGAATLWFIAGTASYQVGATDFQIELLTDQLKRYKPGAANRAVLTTVNAVLGSIPGAGSGTAPQRLAGTIKRLNTLFASAVAAQVDKNYFSPVMFRWYMATRHGVNWADHSRDEAVFGKLVRNKTALLNSSYRIDGPFAADTVVRLLYYDVHALYEKWLRQGQAKDIAAALQDLYLREMTATKSLGSADGAYWRWYRGDDGRKIHSAAARMLQQFKTLPFGYGGTPSAYDRANFWNWHARALAGAAPADRDALIAALEACYGRTRYDFYAMGWPYFLYQAKAADPAGRKQYFDRLTQYLDRAAAQPDRFPAPDLRAVAAGGDRNKLQDPELEILLRMVRDHAPWRWQERHYAYPATERVASTLADRKRYKDLHAILPQVCRIARDTREKGWAERLVLSPVSGFERGGQHELAAAFATAALQIGVVGGAPRETLAQIRSKALVKVAGIVPVRRRDPRYTAFAAQAAYLAGRLDTAWQLCSRRSSSVHRALRSLDPDFCLWLMGKGIENTRDDLGVTLAREMLAWVESNPRAFDPEIRARLAIVYGDIALAAKEYPRARAQYKRIAAAQEYKETRARLEAELRVNEVDRQLKNYGQAVRALEQLLRRKDSYLQTEARYLLARVKFDQEEYPEAKEQLEQVFARRPDHANARILEGELLLKMRRLEEARELKIGLSTDQKLIVPGKLLKVSLEDKNLTVVGKASDIQIRVWTGSGDEEFFSLRPFGDSKTRFQGQVATALAAVRKRDHVLQLLGGDKVYYDFSEAFKTANSITSRPHVLAVASDAKLYASSGKILTEEEQKALALEKMIAERLREEGNLKEPDIALSTIREADQIRPGNPINVRVVDPDRSDTLGKDKITVRATAASGDLLTAQVLEETGEYTGVFEGTIVTAPGQATAYATDSAPGREPNFAISSGDYPAWVALADNIRPKVLSVDLKDNVALGKTTVLAKVPGRQLKDFLVQTSLNGRDFVTWGRWPGKYSPWDGTLSCELFTYDDKDFDRKLRNRQRLFDELTAFASVGYMHAKYGSQPVRRAVAPLTTLAPQLDAGIYGKARELGITRYRPPFLAHYRAAFFQPRRQMRTFKLDAGGASDRFLFALDGKLSRDREAPQTIKRLLSKGVHRIDVFLHTSRGAKLGFRVIGDVDKPPYMAPCPPEMFDVKKHPEIPAAILHETATITPDKTKTSFDIAFPKDVRARIVRLVLLDFGTDAPGINRITLTDAAAKAILPTKEDFMALRKNQTLEIVPGDRVTVIYEDPKVVTKTKEKLEARLSATFFNARIDASFVQYREDAEGNREPVYIPMRRFEPGDTVAVLINDPDGDVSSKLDTLTFTAKTLTFGPVKFLAIETEKHSGVFLGKVFPVSGQPKRKSEIPVKEGDDITFTYADKENTDPGIPWERTCAVEQTWYRTPELRVYDVMSQVLSDEDRETAEKERTDPKGFDHVPITRGLMAVRRLKPDNAKPGTAMISAPLLLEILFPTIARSPNSRATLYVQTERGRKLHGKPIPEGSFDTAVPGTLKLTVTPGGTPRNPAVPPGYSELLVHGDPNAGDPLDDGRFVFSVPVRLGDVPRTSLVEERRRSREPWPISVGGTDTVHVGFKYKDDKGQERWLTQKVALTADPLFHVMDRHYRETLPGAYVGETLYVRVIDGRMDTSDEKDVVKVELTVGGKPAKTVELMETFGHSGVFKGFARLVFAGGADAKAGHPDTLPVRHGDSVVAAYKTIKSALEVFKGADGRVLCFTRSFKDPIIAVQTQLTIAESYFELAKKHRALGQQNLARREIAQGKKLLQEAVKDFPATDIRAQAEYLLADLALEFANDAKNEDLKRKFQMEAVARFSDIVTSYPDSPYAPKAQYKKALVFEKMGKIDDACAEYVKLSYRYPESELVAETIARLGQYFLRKGKETQSKSQREKDEVKREAVEMQAKAEFTTAAQVFGRLGSRFPDHHLAAKTSVLSAQCYMRAEDYLKAIEVFRVVIKNPKAANELVAESMFWCGECYMKSSVAEEPDAEPDKELLKEAYKMYKKLTWDYPASKWAKFARGRLVQPELTDLDMEDE